MTKALKDTDIMALDPALPRRVREFLRAAGFRPSAVMGQNFLVDRNVLDRMLEAAEVHSGEQVLEIGPGLGILTAPLLERSGRLVAVEKDCRLHDWLCERLSRRPQDRFVLGDYLELAPRDPDLRSADAVISNLPYAVAARILVGMSLWPSPPERMLVTVQQEVARRLTAGPGEDDYGLLSVLVGDVYDTALIRKISPTCFYPTPAVWSAIVRLRRRANDAGLPVRPPVWLPLLRHAFSRRRKQMAAILADGPWLNRPSREMVLKCLAAAGIEPAARPENLGIYDWRRLAEQCSAMPAEGRLKT